MYRSLHCFSEQADCGGGKKGGGDEQMHLRSAPDSQASIMRYLASRFELASGKKENTFFLLFCHFPEGEFSLLFVFK